MKKLYITLALAFACLLQTNAQTDSVRTVNLQEFQLREFRNLQPIAPLPIRNKTWIIGGRKSEVIQLKSLPANLAEKTGRQIFAKIPGAMVYDMDGSGNQVNLSVRGLDAHRSWEFNVRQDGVMINTDIYGYPASHYSMPMEAVDRIELVRGTGALQYGQQFGGMLNYVLKGADTTKVFSFENLSTVGSYGLMATYNAIGGKIGKLSYYAYYQKRVSEGYRDHAGSTSEAQHVRLEYAWSDRLNIRTELSRSTYQYQIPGPLNDEMFHENPRQSTRTRNHYSPEIWIPAVTVDWKISPNTALSWISSGVFGSRSSVTFDGLATVVDKLDPVTLQYPARNVDIDNYHTRTSEARLLHRHALGGLAQDLSVSLRYFNNSFDRRQRGRGTTGSDYDLSVDGSFLRDINLHSESLALAIENQIFVTQDWSISPGIRIEQGSSQMTGQINYVDADKVPQRIGYDFVTLGVHTNYQLANSSRLYGGISQANRPVLFQDIIPGDALTVINPDLEDSFGYNAEVGWENTVTPGLTYNFTLFRTYIANRIGNLLVQEGDQTLVSKSNIGNSETNGIEFYLDWELFKSADWSVNFYTATSYLNARYLSGEVVAGESNRDISGNRVEGVPHWISRNGLSANYDRLQVLLQHQYVGESFADALNTRIPPVSGAVGPVPAYHVWDLNTSYEFNDTFIIRAGVNNLLDKQYFTKRPQMYPGPGIWPSDGRSIVFSVGFKL